jgi:hypothetical protein
MTWGETVRQVQHIGLLALAGCAVAVTAACTSPSTSAAGQPSTGPSAVPSASAAASPTASPRSTATAAPVKTSSQPSSGQGGQGKGGQGQGEVNWARVSFRALGCKHHDDLPDRAEVQHVKYADLTGDGRRDSIVAASCPTTTSTNAVHVFVFDAGSTSQPLLTIGKESYLRTAEIETSGRTLTVESKAISKQGSLCCPDEEVHQSWKWTGKAFTRIGIRTEKIS